MNLTNGHGLAALHTAARFGVAAAVSALLTAPGVLPNLRWRRVNMWTCYPTCRDVVTTCDMLVCDVIAWCLVPGGPLSTPCQHQRGPSLIGIKRSIMYFNLEYLHTSYHTFSSVPFTPHYHHAFIAFYPDDSCLILSMRPQPQVQCNIRTGD